MNRIYLTKLMVSQPNSKTVDETMQSREVIKFQMFSKYSLHEIFSVERLTLPSITADLDEQKPSSSGRQVVIGPSIPPEFMLRQNSIGNSVVNVIFELLHPCNKKT